MLELYARIPSDTITITWSVEDVLQQAKDTGILITRAQALVVLHQLKKQHDANHGITWETIDACLSQRVEN